MRVAGGRRHEQLAANDLVAVAVLRQPIEIGSRPTMGLERHMQGPVGRGYARRGCRVNRPSITALPTPPFYAESTTTKPLFRSGSLPVVRADSARSSCKGCI